jgi:hypothetical protein
VLRCGVAVVYRAPHRNRWFRYSPSIVPTINTSKRRVKLFVKGSSLSREQKRRSAVSKLVKVLIIRHAEKPPTKHEPPYGVTADGDQDSKSLVVRGWQRAGALATLLAPRGGVFSNPALATPSIVYAAKAREEDSPATDDVGSKSQRPLQTVAPLAARLHLTVNLSFSKGDEAALAKDVLSRAGVVLICWQHERICAISRHLVAAAPPDEDIPAGWPDERFDVVWVFTPPTDSAGSLRWSFTQVPQQLLDGDIQTVFS